MKKTKIAGLLALCLSMLSLGSQATGVDAKLRQTFRDLCVLNLYMEGLLTNAHGGVVVSSLGSSDGLGNGKGLSMILLGENYRQAVATFMDHLVSTVEGMSFANARICNLYDVKVYPGELQREVDNPTFNELLPRIVEEANDPVDAVSRFTNQAFQRNNVLFREISKMGSDLMDRYLDLGWENAGNNAYTLHPERLDLKKEFKTLRDTAGKSQNPFYWDSHYIFPPTPNTPAAWNWYAYPIPQIEQTYREALSRIENGTFQQWWKQ